MQRLEPVDQSSGWSLVFVLSAALVAVVAYLLMVQAAFDFTIDDAFISMRYADNLARHGQLVWNPGETARVEGYSNLLWVLVMAAAFRVLPADPLLIAKILSIVFGAFTLVMLSLLAARLIKHWLAALAVPLLVAVSRPFVVWGCSGMENMLYMFLICLALYWLVREDEEQRFYWITPVALWLICLTRTEGVVFFGAVFLVRLARFAFETDWRRNGLLKGWIWQNALFGVLLAGWLGWKLWHYGSLIPLPVYLKTADGGSGILYVRDFMIAYAPYMPLLLIGCGLTDYRRPFAYPVAALALYLAALSTANPIMGMEFRLILAALPLMVLIAMQAVSLALNHGCKLQRLAAFIAVFLFMLHWEVGFPQLYRGRLKGLARNYNHFLEELYIPLGHWFHEQQKTDGSLKVALHDAGATPFYAADCHVIDILGLNDREFARTPMTPSSLLARNPDYIVLKSASTEKFGNPEDADYGSMSNMIHDDREFHDRYKVDRVWSDNRGFYVVWVFRRR